MEDTTNDDKPSTTQVVAAYAILGLAMYGAYRAGYDSCTKVAEFRRTRAAQKNQKSED